MHSLDFAAERRSRLERADTELRPFVEDALEGLLAGDPDWEDDLVLAASTLWLEIFEREADGGNRRLSLARFRRDLRSSLNKTTVPELDVSAVQIRRVTYWLSTYTANSATTSGAFSRGVRFKKWVSMHDDDVRHAHSVADGQIVPMSATFEVDGERLSYPGEPVGPAEVWINCRCLAQPAARDGEAMSGTTYVLGPEDDVQDDNPDVIVGEKLVADASLGVSDPTDIAVEPPDEEDLIDDTPEEGEELITEIPVHGVLAPEGVATGDGRMFALGALSTRPLPVPLRYEVISTHGGSTSDVVTVGRIDEAWRDEATNMWRYKGAVVLTKPYAQEVIDGIIDGTIRGVSIDGDDAEVEIPPDEMTGDDDTELDMDMIFNPPPMVFSKMRVAGLTIVAIPAFHEAYVSLGHDFVEDMSEADVEAAFAALTACGCMVDVIEDDDIVDLSDDPEANARAEAEAAELEVAFAPGTHDGPGWITHPVPTKRIRDYWVRGKGSLKIKWGAPGDFNRCRLQLAKYVQNPDWLAGLCANMHFEALGIWPATHAADRATKHAALVASGGIPAPIASLVAAPITNETYAWEWFQNPGLDHAEPLTIQGNRIWGYVAEWGVCHVGVPGTCEEVPQTLSDYGYFRKGIVDTDQGPVAVGTITYGVGHPSEYMRAAAATEHYDKTDAVRAYVNIGEDAHGIWFAGVLAPWVTDADVAAMRAIGALSGDWRAFTYGGNLELIAAVVVAVPGYQLRRTGLAASGGYQTALIAAGRVPARAPKPAPRNAFGTVMDADMIAAIARTAVAEARHLDKVEARATPARETIRAHRLAAARARVERG